MQSLIDKTVLVTGAAGGFGQSMVWQFLREGCKVILSDLDEAKLRAATRETLNRHELPLGEAILGYIAADYQVLLVVTRSMRCVNRLHLRSIY